MILYILLASLLFLGGCAHRPAAPTDLTIVEEVEEFDICSPPRGEDVKFELRKHGHSYNSTIYDCT